MLLGALILHGVQPGPLLMLQQPEMFWGVVASMYIGNIFLLILNLPFIGLFVRILRLPQAWLLPCIVLLCLVGTYAVSNSMVDLWVLVISGVIGWALRKFGFEPALIVLALVLGPILEKTFRQTLIMTRGDLSMVAERPISLGLLVLACAIVLAPVLTPTLRRIRARA